MQKLGELYYISLDKLIWNRGLTLRIFKKSGSESSSGIQIIIPNAFERKNILIYVNYINLIYRFQIIQTVHFCSTFLNEMTCLLLCKQLGSLFWSRSNLKRDNQLQIQIHLVLKIDIEKSLSAGVFGMYWYICN